MKRRTLAILAVGALAMTAGCAGVFGGDIPQEELDAQPPKPYDWNTTQDVTITIENGTYRAVYDMENTTRLELYQPSIGNDQPLPIRSVRYRYPNGTVINGSNASVTVTQEGNNRVVEVPNASGHLAYTSTSRGKEFRMPAYVEGSYEVILPPNHRTNSLVFGGITPGGHETEVRGDRLHIFWPEVTGNVHVRYFLARDKLIFQGLVVLLGLVAVGGVLYYYHQIRKLKRRREEMGLDVETDDDDFGRDPPPGMR